MTHIYYIAHNITHNMLHIIYYTSNAHTSTHTHTRSYTQYFNQKDLPGCSQNILGYPPVHQYHYPLSRRNRYPLGSRCLSGLPTPPAVQNVGCKTGNPFLSRNRAQQTFLVNVELPRLSRLLLSAGSEKTKKIVI